MERQLYNTDLDLYTEKNTPKVPQKRIAKEAVKTASSGSARSGDEQRAGSSFKNQRQTSEWEQTAYKKLKRQQMMCQNVE